MNVMSGAAGEGFPHNLWDPVENEMWGTLFKIINHSKAMTEY